MYSDALKPLEMWCQVLNLIVKMLLNPDWCTEVRDITLLQPNPAHFEPVRKSTDKLLTNSTDYFVFMQDSITHSKTLMRN